jgi:hypothetical protein
MGRKGAAECGTRLPIIPSYFYAASALRADFEPQTRHHNSGHCQKTEVDLPRRVRQNPTTVPGEKLAANSVAAQNLSTI